MALWAALLWLTWKSWLYGAIKGQFPDDNPSGNTKSGFSRVLALAIGSQTTAFWPVRLASTPRMPQKTFYLAFSEVFFNSGML